MASETTDVFLESGAYYNPLDMVYLEMDDDPETRPILVPAILVKALADDDEWKRIKFTEEVLFDIFVIVASVLSLVYGNAPAALVALDVLAIADATIDLGMLSFIPDDDPAKQYYIDNWRQVSQFAMTPVNVVAIGALAKDIIVYGPKMIAWMATRPAKIIGATRKIILQSVVRAMLEIETANLVKGSLRVLEPKVQFFNVPSFINRPEYLYEAGAILVDGSVKVGKAEKEGIGLLYKGELIIFEEEKAAKAAFREFEGLKGEKMVAKLDEAIELKELYRNVGKFTIRNEGEIDAIKLAKIASRIQKEYAVELHLVDRNNQRFTELFKGWQENPIDGMWVETNLISKNYGVPLQGPGVYLFSGTAYKNEVAVVYTVTSYTLQHELFHLEMWTKIKKLYPQNYSQIFHSIPDEIHETYVLSQFVKSKQYTQWEEANMFDDLKAFNDNFDQSKSLDDFRNFDLEQFLKNK